MTDCRFPVCSTNLRAWKFSPMRLAETVTQLSVERPVKPSVVTAGAALGRANAGDFVSLYDAGITVSAKWLKVMLRIQHLH